MTKQIDYYGDEDNYIHLKWGDCVKMYNFTDELIEKYPLFTTEYKKYWDNDDTCQFKNPYQIINYVFDNDIPINFYFNFTDTPVYDREDIIEYLDNENENIPAELIIKLK